MKFAHAIFGVTLGLALAVTTIALAGTITPLPELFPGSESRPIDKTKALSPQTKEALQEFSTLVPATSLNFASLSARAREMISFEMSTRKKDSETLLPDSLSARTLSSGNEVVMFTVGKELCVISIRVEQNPVGTCHGSDNASRGTIFVGSPNIDLREVYVLGVVPDEVKTLKVGETIVRPESNVYEVSLPPQETRVTGSDKSGGEIFGANLPLSGMYPSATIK